MAGNTSQADARAAAQATQAAANAKAAQNQADQAAGKGAFAPAKSAAPVNLNGGQGKIGGPYGVQSTSGHENAYGESQIQPTNKPPDWTQNAKDYGSSLVNNAGLEAGSKPYNDAMTSYLTANNLKVDNEQSQSSDISKPLKFDENYGYTNSKPTSLVSKNTNKNPLEVNLEIP